jgi:hypothetical protein
MSSSKPRGCAKNCGEPVDDRCRPRRCVNLGHLKQILEIKRYRLYPRMRNMRAFYKLS